MATAAETKEKERGTGAALRRGTFAALLVVTAAVAGGLFLWLDIEDLIAPPVVLKRTSPPPAQPTPGPVP
ncbi:MAG: hypothetical protein IH906_04775, partial [Proteobacteria bacterium]|nr:hypothetical protein [Pseudomonadota bacterium]